MAFRLLAGGLAPDHVTIARFRAADALAAVLVDSLRLCAAAGLLRLGTVATMTVAMVVGLPPQMRHWSDRLARLRAAKAQLEDDAAQRAGRFVQRSGRVNTARRAAKGLPPRVLRPRPKDESPRPAATANVTDPDSRLLRGQRGLVQCYKRSDRGSPLLVSAPIDRGALTCTLMW